MSDTTATSHPAAAPVTTRAYESPALERFGTFRELTQAGGSGNCDPSLVLGPETGTGTNQDRCYD